MKLRFQPSGVGPNENEYSICPSDASEVLDLLMSDSIPPASHEEPPAAPELIFVADFIASTGDILFV